MSSDRAPMTAAPDHPALERATLELWDRQDTFAKLGALNSDGPTFSFIDRPVTANKTMGVHTA